MRKSPEDSGITVLENEASLLCGDQGNLYYTKLVPPGAPTQPAFAASLELVAHSPYLISLLLSICPFASPVTAKSTC
jgi:hypothetical protein